MSAVIDASAAVELLLGSRTGEDVRNALNAAGGSLHAPHHMATEVVSAVRRLAAREAIGKERARDALSDLAAMAIEYWPTLPLVDRIWQLRENFTPFDAAYLALAEVLDATLATTDEPLARAAATASPAIVALVN
jgi:predicted nucleic acid-binding protein